MGTASLTGLKVTHLIPQRRTTRQYMSRLLAGKAESQVILSSLYELDNDNHSRQRLRILKLKYLVRWIRYAASGFSLQFHLALSKMRGELQGFKRLRDLGLLGQNGADRGQISRGTESHTETAETAPSTCDEHRLLPR
jgi:hypothetical protein